MKKIVRSLRLRYLVFAIALALVMLFMAFSGHKDVTNTRQVSAANLETRNTLLESSRRLRVSLLNAYKSLDVFLLEPELKQFRTLVEQNITEAIGIARSLKQHLWVLANNEVALITSLESLLISFQKEANVLFETRLDVSRQYPSLAVGGTVLQPNRNRFNNAIALAIADLHDNDIIRKDPEVYKAFERMRHLWTQMLSNFRLYLANRVGSFNEASLPIQEKGIDTTYQELRQQLTMLYELAQAEKLSFETEATVEEMDQTSAAWYEGFVRVKAIHHSGEWRIDSKLMKERIAPLIDQISTVLGSLDNKIGIAAADDINTVNKTAASQSNILWMVAGFGLLFLIIIVVSMELFLFRPVALVARALKAEAFTRRADELPAVRSREMQDLIVAFGEMSRQVHQRQSELEHQATHDSLTSLPNRVLLHDRIEHEIGRAHRSDANICLMVIDLDRFKEVNDTLGHHIGDRLLIEVGMRFTSVLREIDTVARLGGDEFAILLPDTNEQQSLMIAKKLNKSLEDVIPIDELQLYINASIGIALYPQHGGDLKSLLQHADVAMYKAKHEGIDHAVYDPAFDEFSMHRLELTNELRVALEQDLLSLQYQPKVHLQSGQKTGLEALLRWKHKSFGDIEPPQIIEIAERTGLIRPLTHWVINTALRQCRYWTDVGVDMQISVNLSAHNLKEDDLVEFVGAHLEKYALQADALCLEITESAMMANPVHAVELLSRLDEMGVHLSIDDFGTGFSSLLYLKQFPVDELKIDKSFVMDMIEDSDDEAIVRSIIDLAHNLGLEVVAEGVESGQARARLKQMGCDIAQGYYFSKPFDADELGDWLRKPVVD